MSAPGFILIDDKYLPGGTPNNLLDFMVVSTG